MNRNKRTTKRNKRTTTVVAEGPSGPFVTFCGPFVTFQSGPYVTCGPYVTLCGLNVTCCGPKVTKSGWSGPKAAFTLLNFT